MCPKADLPAPRSALDSKSVASGGTLMATGAALIGKNLDAVNQAASQVTGPLQQSHDTLQQFGLWDTITSFASSNPALVGGALGVLVIGLGAFVAYDRIRSLRAEAH